MRASEVVKRQSTRIASRLRYCCHAPTSRRRALWSEIQRFKHCRASAPISISAISIQLPATRSSRVAKTWECSGPPTVRRCAALRQVQIPRTARLGGVQSLPRTGYRVGFPLTLQPFGRRLCCRFRPSAASIPSFTQRQRTRSTVARPIWRNPDNLFVPYGSAPLPLIAQQQNSGAGLPVCCRPPPDTSAFSSCRSSVVNLPGIS